jgi:hypothetical protein
MTSPAPLDWSIKSDPAAIGNPSDLEVSSNAAYSSGPTAGQAALHLPLSFFSSLAIGHGSPVPQASGKEFPLLASMPAFMQTYLFSAIKSSDDFNHSLCMLSSPDDKEAAAFLLGVALPAIFQWQRNLYQCVEEAHSYERYPVKKETSHRSKAQTKPSASAYDPEAPYCSTCGRCGHEATQCIAASCVCCKPITHGKNSHCVTDKDHDKARSDFVPRKKTSSNKELSKKARRKPFKTPSLNLKIKSKEGDSSLSRSYSKRGLSSSYSKAKTAVTPTAYGPDDLKDLSSISHPLDKTLVESLAFVPEDTSTSLL